MVMIARPIRSALRSQAQESRTAVNGSSLVEVLNVVVTEDSAERTTMVPENRGKPRGKSKGECE